MPKTDIEEVQSAVVLPQVTLQEFCIFLSGSDNRVELISGFDADERAAGRLKDSEEAYQARYQAFINRPA